MTGVKAEGHLDVSIILAARIHLFFTIPHPHPHPTHPPTQLWVVETVPRNPPKQLSKYLPITRAEMMKMSKSLAPPARSLVNWTDSPKSARAIRCLPGVCVRARAPACLCVRANCAITETVACETPVRVSPVNCARRGSRVDSG